MIRAEVVQVCAEVAYTAERTVRKALGKPPRDTWTMADEGEHVRWETWVMALLGGALPKQGQALAASVAIAAARELGLQVDASASSQNSRIGEMIDLASKHFDIDTKQIRGPMRYKGVCHARHVTMFLAREAGHSFPEIGRYFGNRDHGTVMSAVRKIGGLVEARDARTIADLATLRAQLGDWLRAA